MRKLLMMVSLGTLAAAGATVVAAQDNDRATPSRSYALNGFDEVSVIGPHRVVISVGPAFSIRAEGSQQALDDTEVQVEDGKLKIQPIEDERWEPRRHDRAWRWDNHQAATYHITLPALEAVSLVGGANMQVDRVEGAEFAASIAGSGDLDVATMHVNDARFSIAGSGDLVARGNVGRSRVSIAGSGNLHAQRVSSRSASISIAGSGDAALTVQDDARISIVGSGDVDISGSARCSVSRMGSGRVRCGGETVDS